MGLLLVSGERGHAQAPREGEVRQIVSFTLLPGAFAETLELYRTRALPLYRDDDHMMSLRVFREVESPVPVDLVVVRSFHGMAGMDASNVALRELAAGAGTSISALYGQIGALTSGHTDQFVEMLPALGWGDPSSQRLTAFFSYRVQPGASAAWEREIQSGLDAERAAGVQSSTGRFLVADGWSHLRILGFDSLGHYQTYLEQLRSSGARERRDSITANQRAMILTSVDDLAVR